jgi:hypothetical protein
MDGIQPFASQQWIHPNFETPVHGKNFIKPGGNLCRESQPNHNYDNNDPE